MKIGITGHTSGIGQALWDHLITEHDMRGFSRRTGYDISLDSDRDAIVSLTQDCDMFINNAYNNFDRSQYHLLVSRFEAWQGQPNRCIINISSRWTHDTHAYSVTKREQDEFCLSKVGLLPTIINIKPGLIDTPRVKALPGERQSVNTIVELIQLVLDTRTKFNITSVTFGV